MKDEEKPEFCQDEYQNLLKYLKPTTNKDGWHTAGTTPDWEQIEKDYRQANLKMMTDRGYGMLAHETVKWFKERIEKPSN
jgi:hypothetical protein